MLELIFNNFDKLIFPLLVGCLLALTASVLGVVLVLKRYSMIGDGLSHVTFGVFAIALGIDFVITVIWYLLELFRYGAIQTNSTDTVISLLYLAALFVGFSKWKWYRDS